MWDQSCQQHSIVSLLGCWLLQLTGYVQYWAKKQALRAHPRREHYFWCFTSRKELLHQTKERTFFHTKTLLLASFYRTRIKQMYTKWFKWWGCALWCYSLDFPLMHLRWKIFYRSHKFYIFVFNSELVLSWSFGFLCYGFYAKEMVKELVPARLLVLNLEPFLCEMSETCRSLPKFHQEHNAIHTGTEVIMDFCRISSQRKVHSKLCSLGF